MGYERLWNILGEAQDKILKKSRKCRGGERWGEGVVEGEWVTDEIREGIDERRRLKRRERNCTGEERGKWEREWRLQKARVQILVYEAKRKWEEDLTRKARDSGDCGRTLWRMVNRLRGKVGGGGERRTFMLMGIGSVSRRGGRSSWRTEGAFTR